MQGTLNGIDDNIRKAEESNSNLNKLDMMVCAMWELMQEKGYTREQLNAKLDRIRESNETLEARQNVVLCPKCGKKVIESSRTPFEGTCLYCGQNVTIYPGDSIEIEGNEPSEEPAPADGSEPVSDELSSSSFFGDQDIF